MTGFVGSTIENQTLHQIVEPTTRRKRVTEAESEFDMTAVVREVMVEANGDREAAWRLLYERARDDENVLDAALSAGCVTWVGRYITSGRAAALRPEKMAPTVDHEREYERAIRSAKLNVSTLLDFVLEPGLLLRDATREDLKRCIAQYAEQIGRTSKSLATMQTTKRWLELTAAKLPARKTVGQAFKNDDLLALQVKAGEGI